MCVIRSQLEAYYTRQLQSKFNFAVSRCELIILSTPVAITTPSRSRVLSYLGGKIQRWWMMSRNFPQQFVTSIPSFYDLNVSKCLREAPWGQSTV